MVPARDHVRAWADEGVGCTGTGRPVLPGITKQLGYVDAPSHVEDLVRYRARGYRMAGNRIAITTDHPEDLVEVHPHSRRKVDLGELTVELVVRETIPLLQHEQFHEHDHIGMRATALIGVALVERGQPGTKQLPVNQIFDLIERVTTGGDGRILLVEKKVPERAHPERSIVEWIKVSWGLSLFSITTHSASSAKH